LTATVATIGGTAGAVAIAQSTAGIGASETGTVGPATTVTASPGSGASPPSGPPHGTAAEQTHPAMLPRNGGPHTRFAVRLTLAQMPGHTGVLAVAYRPQITAPAGVDAGRCSPSNPPASIDSGRAGETLRMPLRTPRGGWCSGVYRVTIFLERGPYCPRPSAGQPPPPCPEFATQELDVGETHFIVKQPRHS
jgi:hypothetical protein